MCTHSTGWEKKKKSVISFNFIVVMEKVGLLVYVFFFYLLNTHTHMFCQTIIRTKTSGDSMNFFQVSSKKFREITQWLTMDKRFWKLYKKYI